MNKNNLFYDNKYLVLYLLKKIDYPFYLKDDLIQAGYLGLWKAINNYDLNKNINLSSYATKYIMGAFFNEIKINLKDNLIKNKKEDVFLFDNNFEDIIKNLNQEEKIIIRLKFILNYNFKQISLILKKNENYVKRKFNNIKKILKDDYILNF